MKTTRKIVEIDEEKCTGCGVCIPSCAEGAISIIDGKARLIADKLCDGLGACLGNCPENALRIIEREADDFDEHAVEMITGKHAPLEKITIPSGSGCPSCLTLPFAPAGGQSAGKRLAANWPLKIRLVPENAPFLQGASSLLIAADCVPVAFPDFHEHMKNADAVLIGCPKFEDKKELAAKFNRIFRNSHLNNITIMSMEVPCCKALPQLVGGSLEHDRNQPLVRSVIISRQGTILQA